MQSPAVCTCGVIAYRRCLSCDNAVCVSCDFSPVGCRDCAPPCHVCGERFRHASERQFKCHECGHWAHFEGCRDLEARLVGQGVVETTLCKTCGAGRREQELKRAAAKVAESQEIPDLARAVIAAQPATDFKIRHVEALPRRVPVGSPCPVHNEFCTAESVTKVERRLRTKKDGKWSVGYAIDGWLLTRDAPGSAANPSRKLERQYVLRSDGKLAISGNRTGEWRTAEVSAESLGVNVSAAAAKLRRLTSGQP